MGSLLGFQDETVAVVDDDEEKSTSSSSSYGYKLVPWLNWNEWECVRDSFFSESPENILSAINRISTWRSRGCLPVVIDVTASIIEVQQKDPLYRKDLPDNALHSEQMLAMLYCMAILRLVNCVVEKTRKKTQVSIAEAAGAIGIPRTLIDIRHEGSHRDLPALALVQDSAVKAIDWLKSYYWEPQTKQIPFQSDGTASIRKEIESKLLELVSCLKVKKSPEPGSSAIKEKRSKKNITKTLKNLVRLYSSFSSEVLSVLFEFLLQALDSSNLVELTKGCLVGEDMNSFLDDWKLVITKFSKKEPELLLMLLKAVLNMIDAQEAMKYEMGTHLTSRAYRTETGQIERLSSLFAWLVGQLKGLKPLRCKETAAERKASSIGMNLSNTILMEVLRKCLLVSSNGNKQLMDSALHLAQLMGDTSVMGKLKKLSSLVLSDPDVTQEKSSLPSLNNLLIQQDESIHQATKKLEFVKFCRTKSKAVKRTDGEVGSSGGWAVAKSWNPCPIGMLPRDLGSSGHLPVLDCADDGKKPVHSSEWKQSWELKQGSSGDIRFSYGVERTSSKREAGCDIYLLDKSSAKKMRETADSFESDCENVLLSGDDKGCLMINGVWKKIGEEELLTIMSDVRILV
uniref:Las1-like family protein n=1 Tax=Populus trichocarpa TaxID=3694 RepID=A0A2K2C4J5_POPTR|eukprot:XP_002298459.3 protein LAS1 [Populus trichocarpa]